MIEPKLVGASIVLRGAFNPPIFQPAWFASEGLISAEESQDATKEVLVHREFVSFVSDSFDLQVTSDQFQVGTSRAPSFSVLRDVVVGTFTLLSHTPVKALGVNRFAHYLMPSEDDWHKLGQRLAPPSNWEGFLKKPGMASITILAKRPDDRYGSISITVEPSAKHHPGVYVAVNDHFAISETLESSSCPKMLEVLKSSWDACLARADGLINHVLDFDR